MRILVFAAAFLVWAVSAQAQNIPFATSTTPAPAVASHQDEIQEEEQNLADDAELEDLDGLMVAGTFNDFSQDAADLSEFDEFVMASDDEDLEADWDDEDGEFDADASEEDADYIDSIGE